MTLIVGISGKARSGKDTVAQYIKRAYGGFKKVSFAEELKRKLAKQLGVPFSEIVENKNQYRPALIELGLQDPRGRTDAFLEKHIEKEDLILITDVRFQYEAEAILKATTNTILIRINRPGYDNRLSEEVKNSKSETELDNWPMWDIVYNNVSTLQHLKRDVMELFEQEYENCYG
jgi:dephospho-CoA kinase